MKRNDKLDKERNMEHEKMKRNDKLNKAKSKEQEIN